MQKETKQIAIRVSPSTATPASRKVVSGWSRLTTIAKFIVVVPLSMALLGAEIELCLSPQLDVLLTAAGVWGIWAWLKGCTPTLE